MPDERRRPGDRLASALPALARLAAQHHTVPDEAVATLLAEQGGAADPAAFDRARRFVAALSALRRGVEAARQLAVEALTMSGLPETAVLEAVEAVAGSPSPWQSQPLIATVERLDLGTLAIGAGAEVSFELTGGPGRIVTDHPQLV